jgi:hypothetical protein
MNPARKVNLRSALVPMLALTSIVLTACAHQPPVPSEGDLPGFFTGLLHGFIMLFSLIGSLFTDVRIYAFPNSGGWYDFGFFLGASLFLGGSGAGARSGDN